MIRQITPLFLLFATAPVSHAASLITPSSGTWVNPVVVQFTGPPPFGVPTPLEVHVPDASLGTVSVTNVINGAGLSSVPTLANYQSVTHATPSFSGSAANAWSSIDAGNAGGDFFADLTLNSLFPPSAAPAGYFNLNFDTPVNLTDLVTWSYNFASEFNGNNVSKWRIDTFDSSGTPLDSGEFDGPNSMSNGAPATISFGQTFSNVSTVQVYPLDNYFSIPGATGGDRIGIAELRFIGASAVPEPTAALTALLGLGLLAVRRRRA